MQFDGSKCYAIAICSVAGSEVSKGCTGNATVASGCGLDTDIQISSNKPKVNPSVKSGVKLWKLCKVVK